MRLFSTLLTVARTLDRAAAVARGALQTLDEHPPRRPAGGARPARAKPGAWIAGQVIPVAEDPSADDCPLEEVLGAFDRLFDPRAPLSARRAERWTLAPCETGSTAPALRVTARQLEAEGARVLRLRRDGRDVALAGVQPVSSRASLRRAS